MTTDRSPAMDRVTVYRATLRHFFAPVARLLYDDESVTEVLINGPDVVYCERGGKLEKTDCRFADAAALQAAVRNLAEYVRRRLDADHLSMDARLPEPEQFRVHAIVPPASRQGTCVSIRKFGRTHRTLAAPIESGSLSAAAAEYLTLMVRTHRNLIVAGGTGSGKTSLLNALSAAIPDDERIVVIEDSSELRLQQPHTIYLEATPPSPTGGGGKTIRELFVDSLRMRPDRILVGEVRRGEALDLVQSMLSGHDGALSTVHASSPRLALVRLETLCLMNDVNMPIYAAQRQVASAIQVVAQIARMGDGSRRVTRVVEVVGIDDRRRYRVRPLFEYREGDGLRWTGRRSGFAAEVRGSRFAHEIRHTAEVFAPADGGSHVPTSPAGRRV
jgi:pilus assembly protein CpaF